MVKSDASPSFPKLDIYLELERRGALPDDKKAIIAELKKRGALPGMEQPESNQEVSKPKESIGRTVFDQSMQGATFGFADEITDKIGSAIAEVGTAIEGTRDINAESSKAIYDDARQGSKERLARQVTQNPLTSIASNIAGGLFTGGAAASTKAGTSISNLVRGGKVAEDAGTLARAGNLALRSAKGSAVAAPTGALYGAGVSEDGKRLEGAQTGAKYAAAFGAGAPVVAAAGGAVKNAVIPQVEKKVGELATRARELGIPLRADQVAPTRARNTIQKVSQEIPLSGAGKFEEQQLTSFNKALAKTIGQDADDLGPETIKKFLQATNDKFSSVLEGKMMYVSPEAKKALDGIVHEAENTIHKDLASIVKKNIDTLAENLADNSSIKGEILGSFRSTLLNRMTSADTGVKNYLGKVVEVLDDIVEKTVAAQSHYSSAGLNLKRKPHESTNGTAGTVTFYACLCLLRQAGRNRGCFV